MLKEAVVHFLSIWLILFFKHLYFLICFHEKTRNRFFVITNDSFLSPLKYSIINTSKSIKCTEIIYRKIPLICPGRIYRQRTNLTGLFSGRRAYIRGGLIFGRKYTSICNLLNIIFFLSSSIKHVTRHFLRRARFEVCSKLTIKTLE